MNSRIYLGHHRHTRLETKRHGFTYPMYTFVIDLDELGRLDEELSLFSHNRPGLLSLYDSDYLDHGSGSLRARVLHWLDIEGYEGPVGRIELVTQLRHFGKVFNPVSFFYCYRPDGALGAVIAQVNNTFKETHLYLLTRPVTEGAQGVITFKAQKAFHVSPFFDRSGEYVFRFHPLREQLEIHIDLLKKGKLALTASMHGKSYPLTQGRIWKTLLRFPLNVALILPRIHWQAAKLFFAKRLKVYFKPVPESSRTVRRRPPGIRDRISWYLVRRVLNKIQTGRLDVYLPDGKVARFRETRTDADTVAWRVADYRAFRRIVAHADVGFGEGYVEKDWFSEDLTGLLGLLVRNQKVFEAKGFVADIFGRMVNAIRHRLRPNSIGGATKNIREHYDLSNAYFEQFLDRRMMYSCARFRDGEESLEQAQKNKIHDMIRKARITGSSHVLEIGSGWGGFAIEAAQRVGCRVTTVTVSKEQYEYARRRIKEAGLEDRVRILLTDYRKLKGNYDALVSIEMLEAVGHENLGEYFKVCDRLLKPGAYAAIQVITIPDQRYEEYRRNCDWIQKYIFPGGHLPSLTAMTQAMTKESSFIIDNLEDLGPHYARTLSLWRERYLESWPIIEQMGFPERLKRMWEYYFSYCEAGFENRSINALQLVLRRAEKMVETKRKSGAVDVKRRSDCLDPGNV